MDSQGIIDLIDKRHYKEAQRNLSKRLRKYPKDVSLLIVQARLSLATRNLTECKALSESLCAHSPPITDYEELTQLFDLVSDLRHIDRSYDVPQISTAWSKAIKSARSLELRVGLAHEWATQSIKNEQWTCLYKAALELRQLTNDDAEKRRFWFWHITARYLSGLDAVPGRGTTTAQEVDRQLTVGLLEKCLKDVPQEKLQDPLVRPGLWISSPAELQLLCRAFLSFGQSNKLVDVLNDSRIHELFAHDMQTQFLASMLYSATDPTYGRSRAWAAERLTLALNQHKWHLLDNWVFWLSWIGGSPKRTSDDRLKLIEKVCTESPRISRAPQLAQFKVKWAHALYVQAEMLQLVLAYFALHTGKGFVVPDLGQEIQLLEPVTYQQARVGISNVVLRPNADERMTEDIQLQWLAREVESLELDYTYINSLVDNDAGALPPTNKTVVNLLEALVCNCIRLYRLSQTHTLKLPSTTTEPGDAACLLAVTGLDRLYQFTSRTEYKLLAAILLSYILVCSEHNFDARKRHVVHMRNLGFPSVAWQSYKRLDVKRMLHEKLAPTMFRRIALQQPHTAHDLDAYHAMETVLEFYEQALKDVPEYQELALQHENYSGIADMQNFVKQLRNSPTRITLAYERRRIARFTGKPIRNLDMLNTVAEDTSARALDPRSVGTPIPPPEFYVCYLLVCDAAVEIAMASEHEQRDILDQKATTLIMLRGMCRTMVVDQGNKLTTWERKALPCSLAIVELAEFMSQASSDQLEMIGLLQNLESCLQSCTGELEVDQTIPDEQCYFPTSIWYYHFYTTVELCHACHKICEKVLAFTKRQWPKGMEPGMDIPEDAVKHIQLLGRAYLSSAQIGAVNALSRIQQIRNAKEEVAVKLVLGMPTEIQSTMLELMGTKTMARILTEYAASSEAALKGVEQFRYR